MTKETIDVRWITDTDCTPAPWTILDYDTSNVKDKQLILERDKDMCKLSLWGKNKNFIIFKFGVNTEEWIGKQVFIKQEVINGKKIRTLY